MANKKRLIYLEDAIYLLERDIEENKVALRTAYPGEKEEIRGEMNGVRAALHILKHHASHGGTVDAVEVVHGRWLYDSGSGKHFCSACDEYALSFKKDTLYGGDLYEVCLTDYCPNCGAKMRGSEE